MKTIVSGVQSSGNLTLGNYIGAIKNFVKMQNDLDPRIPGICFLLRIYAITVYQEPAELKENIRKVAAMYLAAGLDPEKVVLLSNRKSTNTQNLAICFKPSLTSGNWNA